MLKAGCQTITTFSFSRTTLNTTSLLLLRDPKEILYQICSFINFGMKKHQNYQKSTFIGQQTNLTNYQFPRCLI